MDKAIDISEFDYPLPDERIARFPLEDRAESKLLLYRNGEIGESVFRNVADFLPEGALVVFNNTKVIRARLLFHKTTGARIEVFCLEPHEPADYERAFAVTGTCEWHCIVGNSKKWKEGALIIEYEGGVLSAERLPNVAAGDVVRFAWSSGHTFGQLLELLGRTPIPPYLCRESEEIDTVRYQTVYSRWEGSVAAPTAGLHFTPEIIASLPEKGFDTAEVTLHVGAGTFLPVKEKDARNHHMHTEFFQVDLATLDKLAAAPTIVAVGTTSVRTLESLAVLGERVILHGNAEPERVVGQWEANTNGATAENALEPLTALAGWMRARKMTHLHAATGIMITPGYRWRVVRGLITNFHQPQSTLLLLISALVGTRWREIYAYALGHGFRFLSYGDSSLLLP